MIRLTKKLLFAIEAVLDIAYNSGSLPESARGAGGFGSSGG